MLQAWARVRRRCLYAQALRFLIGFSLASLQRHPLLRHQSDRAACDRSGLPKSRRMPDVGEGFVFARANLASAFFQMSVRLFEADAESSF